MSPSIMLLVLLIEATTFFSSSSVAHGLATPRQSHGASTRTGNCFPYERDALLEFKKGITGDPARRLASWREDEEDCCRWTGVRCSNWTGHVVSLHLRNVRAYDPLLGFNYVSATALSGQISPSLTSLHHLEHIDLSLNNLSGPAGNVPEFLGLLKNLRYLNLSNMAFSGRIPPQLGNLSNLHYLDLSVFYSFDYLSPLMYTTDISWIKNLPLLHLNMNSVNLSRTADWAREVNMVPSLKVLRLTYCSLANANQSLPHLNLTDLEELSLSGNDFDSQGASCWFWNLTSLQHLELALTNLHGQVPDALGGMTRAYTPSFSAFTYHRYQDIGKFAGIIEFPTSDMVIITHVNLSVITKGQERYYKDGELYGMVSIDLSSNRLYGSIPEEITSLDGVMNLNLSWNQLSGRIPHKIGAMQNLESLDLKENKIYGKIPRSLSNITYLSYLDLSYNNLTGTIPSGGQLDTLYEQYPFMYNGNSGLCGHPLQKNCSNSSEPVHGGHERDEYDSKLLSFSFGLGVGFVAGLWVVFCAFLFKKSWRVTYFRLFDVTFDNFYVFVVVICARWAKGATTY